jgi:predicted transcriptional regulator YheO
MENKDDVIKQYQELADNYKSYDECYNLLVEKNDASVCMFCLDHDGIWKRLELKWILDYFIETEQYEKCVVVKQFMDTDFVGSDKVQKELNDQMELYFSIKKLFGKI